jgi:phosphatidylserine decarboxylase
VKLAPEGLPFVVGGAAILALLVVMAAAAGGTWYLLPLVWAPVALWIAAFFRDPVRSGPRGDRLVLAPADGRVVSVTTVDDADADGGRALRVAIFMNVFNVHVNRHPVDGTVVLRRYRPGLFINASLDKASEGNERMTLAIRTDRGTVVVRQIAGLIARRIVTDPGVGEGVRQGERLGLIRFGSRVDTLLPPGAQARVAPGDRTYAGLTVIAEWP